MLTLGVQVVLTCPLFQFSASRIRYEITSGNIGGAFAVKNMTGAIYVAGALDYETRKRVSTSRRNEIYRSTRSRERKTAELRI
jgi:Cadherin domain